MDGNIYVKLVKAFAKINLEGKSYEYKNGYHETVRAIVDQFRNVEGFEPIQFYLDIENVANGNMDSISSES